MALQPRYNLMKATVMGAAKPPSRRAAWALAPPACRRYPRYSPATVIDEGARRPALRGPASSCCQKAGPVGSVAPPNLVKIIPNMANPPTPMKHTDCYPSPLPPNKHAD